MRFTKMQGLGNDYIYVNGIVEQINKPKETARRISDRHYGVGSDGLIILKSSNAADFKMEIYNADGSVAEMCGNGIRCIAKFAYDNQIVRRTDMVIETLAGIKKVWILDLSKKEALVKVDMGKPILQSVQIPVRSEKNCVVSQPFDVNGKTYLGTAVSMGNPHVVVFEEDIKSLSLEEIGPYFEWNPKFPNRVNTEFVQILDRENIYIRVWERGAKETLACGTGACAAVVASVLNGLTEREVNVKLLGGNLSITWDERCGTVYMTGPAVTVFDGEIE